MITPPFLSVEMEKLPPNWSPPNWYLQGRWLKNPEFVKYVEDKLDVYIQINTTLEGKLSASGAIKTRNKRNKKQKAEIREVYKMFVDIIN